MISIVLDVLFLFEYDWLLMGKDVEKGASRWRSDDVESMPVRGCWGSRRDVELLTSSSLLRYCCAKLRYSSSASAPGARMDEAALIQLIICVLTAFCYAEID